LDQAEQGESLMFQITKFAGEVPKVTPRLLPDGFATVARNCKLVDGAIIPLRYPSRIRTAASSTRMFYKRGDNYFESSNVVDVAPAPIAEDRLYVTGDGPPKIIADYSTAYPLALKKPEAALVAAVEGEIDKDTQNTYLYAYTYVTIFDEESEPSALSNEVLRSPGMDVTLTGFLSPPTGRGVNRIRIYRSQTSASGATDLYMIRERVLPLPQTFVDDVEKNEIQEPIPSLSYNPPPDDLAGIIPLPNGMLAGFRGKDIFISEPWRPHAWPEKYVLTTEFEIVGLGAFGNSFGVMTKGFPYVVTGTAPENMVMERLEVNFPCVSKAGIVDLGFSIAYPCPDGLVTLSGSGALLVTRQVIKRDAWQAMRPETFVASQHDGRYIATYMDRAGVRDTVIIDLTGETPFISRVDPIADYMFFEVGAGKLYFLVGRAILEWDANERPSMNMRWRSKPYIHTGSMSFGAIMTEGNVDAPPPDDGSPPIASVIDGVIVDANFGGSDDDGMSVQPEALAQPFVTRVFADGVLLRETPVFGAVDRLPGGRMARQWELEVEGGNEVTAIAIAPSPSALSVAGGQS
jgi:hypothetical protein